MFITPINISNKQCFGFEGKKGYGKYIRNGVPVQEVVKSTIAVTAGVGLCAKTMIDAIDELCNSDKYTDINLALKQAGVTYVELEDNTLQVATRNNGAFYKIKSLVKIPDGKAKNILLAELNKNDTSIICGLGNYKECVDDLGRQDIIRQGLGIHTYELNNTIHSDKKKQAASLIKKHSKIPVTVKDLFFIEEEAFFYDKINKTVYYVSTLENTFDKKQKVHECKFITDDSGNAIGYNKDAWSIYSHSIVREKYVEQTKPSEKIDECVDINNNKQYAEACRFGNYRISTRNRSGIPNVLANLEKFGFKNVTEKDLQFVKYYTDKNNPDSKFHMINYYNPLSGKSLAFDKDGKYMFQIEYIKNNDGQIISCCH